MLIHAAVTVQRTVGCMRREGVREVVTGKLNLVTTRKKKQENKNYLCLYNTYISLDVL